VYGPHSGNDEAAPVGTPVHAAGDGVIEFAGVFDSTYADNLLWLLNMGGNILVLNCGDNEPTFVYAHLSAFRVKQGQRVVKGQIIADSGNTGSASQGAHLHIEAIPPGYVLNSPLLGRVNPDTYLTEWPEDLTGVITESSTVGEIMVDNIPKKQAEDMCQRIAALVVAELKKSGVMVQKNQAEDIAQRAATLVKGK
jgi:hypothetical protein